MSIPFTNGLIGGPAPNPLAALGLGGAPPPLAMPPLPPQQPIPSPAHALGPQGPNLTPPTSPMPMQMNPTDAYLALIQQQMQEEEKTAKAPYTKPKKKKGKKTPNIDDIKRRADKVVDFWQPRDSRMDEDLALYRLTQDASGEGEVILKNTPYVVVEKAANMIASQVPTVQVVAPKQDAHETAQKIENFLRWSGEKWNKRWRRTIQGSIRHDMAHFLCLRGWMAARITYDDNAEDDEYPIEFKLFDPRQVYPMPGDKGLAFVVQRYWTTYAELMDEWSDQASKFEEHEPTDWVQVTSFYDEWFYCTYTDEAVLMPVTAHEYGFVPWVIVTGNGSPIRATGQNQVSWVRECGVSIFHGIKDSYKELNKVLSQLATQVSNAANPPMVYYYDPAMNKTPQPLDLTPGTTNFLLYDRERVDPINLSPRPTDASPLIDSLIDDMNKGSLPSNLWGQQGGTTSGWNLSIMQDSARDQLISVVEAMQEAFEEANEYTLFLIRDQHDGEIGFYVMSAEGRPTGGVTLTPEEIEQVGCDNIVRYRDVSPKDRAAMAQLGSMLVKDHVISMETAREDYLFIDNPEREEQRVMSDMVKMDPDVIKKGLVPAVLMQTDPALFQLYMGVHPELADNAPPQSQQPQPGPAPQLPPGLPPNVQPPIGQPGANPMMQALGSMLGGQGGTGAPPQLPGTGMQQPLGLPLGL